MLRQEVLDVVNSGEAWALIGSGLSMDAGAPSWAKLVEDVALDLHRDHGVPNPLDDTHVRDFLADQRYDECLSRIERLVGDRGKLDAAVRRLLTVRADPTSVLSKLVKWPFRGYLTTNYDDTIEQLLSSTGQHGWVSIGNSDQEVRKLSGEPSKVIWHVHGSASHEPDRSRLVLTHEDYQDLYLESSPAARALQAIVHQRRLVVFGFGMNDPEVMRLLERLGRYTDPARPIFAFIGGLNGNANRTTRENLGLRHNIEVIPYPTPSNSHHMLARLVDAYGAFIVRRTTRFSPQQTAAPSYDPAAAGLLAYNVMRRQGTGEEVAPVLARAYVLSLLHDSPARSREELVDRSGGRSDTISEAVTALTSSGLLDSSGPAGDLQLTEAGREAIADRAGEAERLREQFLSIVRGRVQRTVADLNEPAINVDRVTQVATSFLLGAVERRSIGIAMALTAPAEDVQEYHVVALLQALPPAMEQLADETEAIALTHIVRGILAEAKPEESSYLGLLLQAHFGKHLLGQDPDTLVVRRQEFEETLFMLDATTTIPLIAAESAGHEAATELMSTLESMGSRVFTTRLITQETAEHIRWALRQFDGGRPGLDALSATTGRAGARSNAVLDGFAQAVASGLANPDVFEYLRGVCGIEVEQGGLVTNQALVAAISQLLPVRDLDNFDGFIETMYADRDALADSIGDRRREHRTYTHQRQVTAEAEATLLVREVRSGALALDGASFKNSFFVSNTRILDDLRPGRPITIRPETVLQWAATLAPPSSTESLSVLLSQLQWDLAEQRLTIIDPRAVDIAFGPIIRASKEHLPEILDQHRAMLTNELAEDPDRAFTDVSDRDLPYLLHSFETQRADHLAEQLQASQGRVADLARRATRSEKEREELARLRMEKKQRQQRHRKRSQASRSKKRKKGKKRK